MYIHVFSKGVCLKIVYLGFINPLPHIPDLLTFRKKAFENLVRKKGKKALGNIIFSFICNVFYLFRNKF